MHQLEPRARSRSSRRPYRHTAHLAAAGRSPHSGAPAVRSRTGRTLHLVDVDNLLGDPRLATPASIRRTMKRYREVAAFRSGDVVVLATNHALALDVGLAWPAARLLARSGPDGADRALLAEVDELFASDGTCRFDRVVTGGGDHIYESAVRRLGEANVDTIVVSRPESLAGFARLRTRS